MLQFFQMWTRARKHRRRPPAASPGRVLRMEQLAERNLLSAGGLGQVTSFFRPDERADEIVSYVNLANDTLHFDEAVSAIEQLETDYVAYGLWAVEDRSTQAWQDFHNVAAHFQVARPETELYAYIGTPHYGAGKRFCWEMHAAGEPCESPGDYSDYVTWAAEVAQLGVDYPIVKGILLDDFSNTTQHQLSPDGRPMADYLLDVRAAGREFLDGFRVDAVYYLEGLSAYDAQRYSQSLDAVHFYYFHVDGNGNDLNPERMQVEVEMFERAYSRSPTSPLATLHRPPQTPANPGDVTAVETDLNLAGISGPIEIAHFDTIDQNTSNLGWITKRILLDGQLIAQHDAAADPLEVHTTTISFEQIEDLRTNGNSRPRLRFEVEVHRGFSSWMQTYNVMVRQPTDLFLRWESDDPSGAVEFASSGDLTSPPKKYLGLYAGMPSFMQVTAAYTHQLIPLAEEAVREGRVHGVVLWEPVMRQASSAIVDAYRTSLRARLLDEQLQLTKDATFHENWGGAGERWLRGADDGWYFLTPAGQLFRWHGGATATGELVAELSPQYFADPKRLYLATPAPAEQQAHVKQLKLATALLAQFELQRTDRDYFNWGGSHEKWLLGRDQWYFIVPDGRLFEWDGAPTASGSVVARLDPFFHQRLDEWLNAAASLVDQQLQLQYMGDSLTNWGGSGEKWFQNHDRLWYYLTPDGRLYRWQPSGNRGLAGSLAGQFPATFFADPQLLSRSYWRFLQSYYALSSDGGAYYNWGGRQENWFVSGNRQWYFLTREGGLYRWDGSTAAAGQLVAVVGPNNRPDF